MAIPTLPQKDPDQGSRAAQLDKAREDYRYDFSNEGILFAEEVPKGYGDGLSARYIAQAGEINARVEANKIAARLIHALEKPLDFRCS